MLSARKREDALASVLLARSSFLSSFLLWKRSPFSSCLGERRRSARGSLGREVRGEVLGAGSGAGGAPRLGPPAVWAAPPTRSGSPGDKRGHGGRSVFPFIYRAAMSRPQRTTPPGLKMKQLKTNDHGVTEPNGNWNWTHTFHRWLERIHFVATYQPELRVKSCL